MNGFATFLESWSEDPLNVKPAFLQLKSCLEECDKAQLSFKMRPGVSYSLRGSMNGDAGLFVMVDVVDDDPEARWLSVCFYDSQITDQRDIGDWVPEGLNGKDARCFDVSEQDADLVAYVEERIREAFKSASA